MKKIYKVLISILILFLILIVVVGYGFQFFVCQNPIKIQKSQQYYQMVGNEYGENVINLISDNATNEEILNTIYSLLPAKVNNLLKEQNVEIKIFDTQEEYVKAVTDYKVANNMEVDTKDINNSVGYTTPDAKIIFLSTLPGTRLTVFNGLHEIGHVLNINTNQPTSTFGFTIIWLTEVNYAHTQYSDYYKTCADEFFADMFAAYCIDNSPEHILDQEFAPKTFEFIENTINSL